MKAINPKTSSGGRRRRPQLRQGVIILPSAFTLGNLFFGTYALVTAARGDLIWAGWFIVFAAVLDLADGRIARFTRTGSDFGAELDSLVDAISFGVAPGFILYQLFLSDTAWGWILSFAYITAVVLRLARFNIEQGGEAKTHFNGLPCPTSGMILATFYPFSQTAFFQTQLGELPWASIMAVVTVILSVLLMSHVPYPLFPKIGFRTRRGLFNTAVVVTGLTLAITVPHYYFFPVLVLYTAWGIVRALILGLLDRLPDRDPLLDEVDDQDHPDAASRPVDYRDLAPGRFGRRRKRKPRRGAGNEAKPQRRKDQPQG
jgi:CDP-diacylglycerol--serine O-phosphatidyltransferase